MDSGQFWPQVDGQLGQTSYDVGRGGEGRFDFQNFVWFLLPWVSVILFYNYKSLEEFSALKIKNCLDAKEVNLYSEIAKISQKSWLYII